MPTEAEWEYACRAGTDTEYYWGDEMDGDYCWHRENSKGQPHTVGQKSPNSWGLYDMSGNVWEWCSDWYGEEYYKDSPQTDPVGPASGELRVGRGGCWYVVTRYLRSAYRYWFNPDFRYVGLGFRLARDVE